MGQFSLFRANNKERAGIMSIYVLQSLGVLVVFLLVAGGFMWLNPRREPPVLLAQEESEDAAQVRLAMRYSGVTALIVRRADGEERLRLPQQARDRASWWLVWPSLGEGETAVALFACCATPADPPVIERAIGVTVSGYFVPAKHGKHWYGMRQNIWLLGEQRDVEIHLKVQGISQRFVVGHRRRVTEPQFA